MSETSFHMEVLSKSINELQQAKARCEHKLRDVRNKRKALEKKCEGAVTRYNQIEEKQSKMVETVKVAQLKVTQSQAELNSHHAMNNELQGRVQQAEDAIAAAEQQHTKDVELFEEKLAELVDKFNRSRHFYTEESLLKEIDLMKQKEKELHQETVSVKEETEKLSEAFSELSAELQGKLAAQENTGITAAQQRDVLSMLMAENQESAKALQDLQERSKAVQAELQFLAQWKPPRDIPVEE